MTELFGYLYWNG